jgi:ubiquinone/menaquinone biosynthesis C-methylase UbiE
MNEPRPSIAPRLWLLPLAYLFLALALLPTELVGQSNRDSWQRVPDVVAALAIGEGSRVADVGAGSGYFTEHLAAVVGDSGRVFAVDISERALSQLRRLAENRGLDNVEVVGGEVDDPRLPEGSLDAILVVDAYHEMSEYKAMLAGMYRALEPGGRLVIIDMRPADSTDSRRQQTRDHRLSLAIVEQEVQAAGFELLNHDEEFTARSRSRGQWLLVARRPETY